jgi:hypothetical protein
MAQHYSDADRENDPHALPNVETFRVRANDPEFPDTEPGWYWWACFPGCIPDGDPMGPFDSEAEALADARTDD